MHFADLTPYDYAGREPGVLNVGWLERRHPYPTGPTPPELVDALLRLCVRSARQCRGIHSCDLGAGPGCEEIYAVCGGRQIVLGNGEVRVTVGDITYAAPTLIVHYVRAHQYQPPAAFIDAVLACAPQLPWVIDDEVAALRALGPGRRALVDTVEARVERLLNAQGSSLFGFGWLGWIDDQTEADEVEHVANLIDAARELGLEVDIPEPP